MEEGEEGVREREAGEGGREGGREKDIGEYEGVAWR